MEPSQRIDPAGVNKLHGIARGPVLPSPETDMVRKISHSFTSTERNWNSVSQLMKSALTKKDMSMQDCLKLQAIMQKYSMELDLTGKVVEKATNGLKDTLKTQV